MALRAPRQVHVPRPPVGVHRARLAGLLRGRRLMEAGSATADLQREHEPERDRRLPRWLLGLAPLLLVALTIGAFIGLGTPGLDGRAGPPAEELSVERTVLTPGRIELRVRNDGPDAVSIAQVQVNDAFVAFSGAPDPIDH